MIRSVCASAPRVFAILAVFAIGGCAHLQEPTSKRYGNTIVSEVYPPADVVVDSGYMFMGEKGFSANAATGVQAMGTSNVDSTLFGFGARASERPERLIFVQLLKLTKPRWTFVRETEWEMDGVIHGAVETAIGEMDTFSGFTSGEDFIRLFAPGFRDEALPCAAATIIRQIPSGMGRYKLRIGYMESIDCDSLDDFYYSDRSMTREGRRQIEQVINGLVSDVRFVVSE